MVIIINALEEKGQYVTTTFIITSNCLVLQLHFYILQLE